MGLFSFLTQELAIDLGTANTLIIHKDTVVVDEPSIIAMERIWGGGGKVGASFKEKMVNGGCGVEGGVACAFRRHACDRNGNGCTRKGWRLGERRRHKDCDDDD